MELPADVVDRIGRDFRAEDVPAAVALVAATTASARLQRCLVFAARGHLRHLEYLCKLARVDERDVIFAAEYAHPQLQLWDFRRPIPQARLDDVGVGMP